MADSLFNLAAGLELLAQGAQFLCNGLYLAVHVLPPPFAAVQVLPLVRQGVYLRLQSVPQHGELGGVVYAVGLQKAELRCIAVQPCDLLADAEGQGRTLGEGLRMPNRYR